MPYPQRREANMDTKTVIVMGAGIGGLVAANELRRKFSSRWQG